VCNVEIAEQKSRRAKEKKRRDGEPQHGNHPLSPEPPEVSRLPGEGERPLPLASLGLCV
jgi:hypothetical protein